MTERPPDDNIIEGCLEVYCRGDDGWEHVTVLSRDPGFESTGASFEIYDVTVLDDLIEALTEARAWMEARP